MRFYDTWAQRILHGQWSDHLAFYGLPLYPYLLALVYKTLGYSPFLPALLQAGADAGTAASIYFLGSEVFGKNPETSERLSILNRQRGPIVGMLAAAGWACFTPAQAYALVVMPTTFAVLIFWLAIAWIVRKRTTPGPLAASMFGTLVGFAATGVATVLFVLPLFLAAIFLKPPAPARPGAFSFSRITAVALLFSGVLIGTAPCWAHNYFVARDPVFLSAHGGINFWIGNNPDAKGYPNFPEGMRAEQASMLQDSTALAEAATGHHLRRSEVSAFWSGRAKTFIASQPGAWLRLLWQKMLNFWNAFEYDDVAVIGKLREAGVLFPGLHFGVVAALALPGIFFALRAFPASGWILAGIVAQLASVLPVFVTERYRLPAVPGLLIFGAFGLWHVSRSCALCRLSKLALYFGLLAASTAFVSIPRTDPALWALPAYTSGRQALEAGDFGRAERDLQRALGFVPESAQTNFALGNLRLAQKRRAEAKSFYGTTLELNPKHKGALNNLGLLALEEDQPEAAAQFFQRVIAQAPNDAKAFYLLAKAELALGQIEKARAAIAQALAREPNQPEYRAMKAEIEQHPHE